MKNSTDSRPCWWKLGTVEHLNGGANISHLRHDLILYDSRGTGFSITRTPTEGGVSWLVTWWVRFKFSPPLNLGPSAEGKFLLFEGEVRAAFDLSGAAIPHNDESLATRFGADICYPGRFIRKGPHLNIPGPGIGHADDSNLSVWVGPDAQRRVERLLSTPSSIPQG